MVTLPSVAFTTTLGLLCLQFHPSEWLMGSTTRWAQTPPTGSFVYDSTICPLASGVPWLRHLFLEAHAGNPAVQFRRQSAGHGLGSPTPAPPMEYTNKAYGIS